MIRIRRVVDDAAPGDAELIARAGTLLRGAFPEAPAGLLDDLAAKLRDPFKQGFRVQLYVSETRQGRLRGAALTSVDPSIPVMILDWVASAPGETGGVGGALVGAILHDAGQLGCVGVFLECLPDDPAEVDDPATLRDNVRRLRFYERFGARPLVDNLYRAPIDPEDRGMPWLVVAPVLGEETLTAEPVQRTVRAILERKYGWLCPPAHVERVVASFQDPITLRLPRYLPRPPARREIDPEQRVALVVHDTHADHRVRERGYVEAPTRIARIESALLHSGLVEPTAIQAWPRDALQAVHDPAYLAWLESTAAAIRPGRRVLPYVFPVRNAARRPVDPELHAGYYCIDTFTPLHRDIFRIALRGTEVARTAAQAAWTRRGLAYALVRPPGHHAERALYGGFCYLNNVAVAAEHLRLAGASRVAILDVDYHHGNGQQQIFYG